MNVGQTASRYVGTLIDKSLYRAKITRAVKSDSYYGPVEGTETVIAAAAPVDLKFADEKTVSETGLSAYASFKSDCGVMENDKVEIDGKRYRVTAVKPKEFFGAITHLECHFELERKSA